MNIGDRVYWRGFYGNLIGGRLVEPRPCGSQQSGFKPEWTVQAYDSEWACTIPESSLMTLPDYQRV